MARMARVRSLGVLQVGTVCRQGHHQGIGAAAAGKGLQPTLSSFRRWEKVPRSSGTSGCLKAQNS